MTDLHDFARYSEGARVRVETGGRQVSDAEGHNLSFPPAVRVVVMYPPGDGTLPDQVEIAWETKYPNVDEVMKVVAALTEMPRRNLDDLSEPPEI